MSIVLASQSPRRRDLLHQIGINEFRVIPAQGEEEKDPGLSPAALVERLSRQKADEVAQRCEPEDLIIAADTIVALDGRILGKPRDEAEAVQMLHALSGRRHEVFSGVTVRRGEQILTEYEETAVFFRPLTDREIDWYVSTGEPLDKAGAYGIQGMGIRFVSRIEGDYTNVVGLPVCRLLDMMGRLCQGDLCKP